MYQQLGDDAGLEEIKQALYAAFGADPFIAWRQFTEQRLEPGETVDVYVADLKKLAASFGGVTGRILGCTFLVGLPDDASRLLRASLRLNELGLDDFPGQSPEHLKRQHRTGLGGCGSTRTANRGPKMLQMWWTQQLL